MPVRSGLLDGKDLPSFTQLASPTYTRKKDLSSPEPALGDLIAWRHVPNNDEPVLVFRSPGDRTVWVDEREFACIVNQLATQQVPFATKRGYELILNPAEEQVGFLGPKTSRGRRRVRYRGGQWIPYPRILDDPS